MSNLNDLYKESGIKPGGGFNGNFNKDKRNLPAGKTKNNLVISFIIAAIIVVACFILFESGTLGSPKGTRVVAVMIIPVAYLINFIIRLFKKLANKIND